LREFNKVDIRAPLAYSWAHKILARGKANLHRTPLRILALFAVAVLVLSGCGAESTPPTPTPTLAPSPQAFDLVLLHTNDVRGFTEPCG